MTAAVLSANIWQGSKQGIGVLVLIMLVLAMIALPLPPIMLDLLFSFNIALSLVILLVSIYCLRPLEFAVFPTVLLIATLLRLALNVGSTRVVLLEGHNGGDAAGQVIEAFGAVVIGGNFAVGLIVFAILVIINFVVVTKGASRISEVSARFTLDAMPGKQMAIDADLNAGIIDQAEAGKRRQEITQEADFYGSMDGASKFVRGDAIAGILILLINLLGGLLIGMLQHDLDFSRAVEFYTLLTIGDGLVAQIPSLLLSTAAAMLITRDNRAQEMSVHIIETFTEKPKTLAITAAVLFILAVIPGMPHLSFLLLAAAVGGLAYYKYKNPNSMTGGLVETEAAAAEEAEPEEAQNEEELVSWDDVQKVDPIRLEIGYRLIGLVDPKQDGPLMSRVKGVRKKLSKELGFLVPAVHICDNLNLAPNQYRIAISGVTVGEGEVHPDKMMAINPGMVSRTIEGLAGKDPAFGLDAVWINQNQQDEAKNYGYTVVDLSTVITTHVSHLIGQHASGLLGHEEADQLVERIKGAYPKLVGELIPDRLSISKLVQVLQGLLKEQIPITDLRTILETLATHASQTATTSQLLAQVRISLKQFMMEHWFGASGDIQAVTIDPELEQLMQQSQQKAAQASGDGALLENVPLMLEPQLATEVQTALLREVEKARIDGGGLILVCHAIIRTPLAEFVRYFAEDVHVVSYAELPDKRNLKVIATLGRQINQ